MKNQTRAIQEEDGPGHLHKQQDSVQLFHTVLVFENCLILGCKLTFEYSFIGQ